MSSEEIRSESGSVADPEPGRDHLNLTDPRAMRALAHPVRIALVELLGVTDSLTATQASEVLAESPANCAFHLRTLAKYGFVVEVGGGKGRERPWKLAHRGIHLDTQHDDPGTTIAARALDELWLDRVLRRARHVLTSSQELPEGWRNGEEATQSVMFLTADEARQLGKDVLKLLDRFKDRRGEPAKRPAGALPVEALFFAYPLADLAAIAAMTDSAPENVRPHRHNGRPVTKEP